MLFLQKVVGTLTKLDGYPKIAQKVVKTAIFDGYRVKSKESSFIEKNIIKKT